MAPVGCACGVSTPVCLSGSHGYVLRFALDTQIQGTNDTSDATSVCVCVRVCACVCACACVRASCVPGLKVAGK